MRTTRLLLITVIFLFITIASSAQSLRTLHEESFEVKPGELLEVQSDIGDIKIRTWDKDEVFIKVLGDDDAEDEVRFTFERTTRGILIDAETDNSWNWFNNVRVKYEIDIPAKFDVDLSTGGGDIVLGDLTGKIELRTSGGDIHIANTAGYLLAKTSGGDVEVKKADGPVEVSTSGGDVRVESSNGSVSAKTSGGDVDLEYFGENEGIQLSTSGGDISAYLPQNLEADLYLRTSGGDIECKLEARIEETSDTKFIGQMNGGGREVTCKTSGGDIIVESF